jgi:D-alanyl-D-alanine carboxypeptidase
MATDLLERPEELEDDIPMEDGESPNPFADETLNDIRGLPEIAAEDRNTNPENRIAKTDGDSTDPKSVEDKEKAGAETDASKAEKKESADVDKKSGGRNNSKGQWKDQAKHNAQLKIASLAGNGSRALIAIAITTAIVGGGLYGSSGFALTNTANSLEQSTGGILKRYVVKKGAKLVRHFRGVDAPPVLEKYRTKGLMGKWFPIAKETKLAQLGSGIEDALNAENGPHSVTSRITRSGKIRSLFAKIGIKRGNFLNTSEARAATETAERNKGSPLTETEKVKVVTETAQLSGTDIELPRAPPTSDDEVDKSSDGKESATKADGEKNAGAIESEIDQKSLEQNKAYRDSIHHDTVRVTPEAELSVIKEQKLSGKLKNAFGCVLEGKACVLETSCRVMTAINKLSGVVKKLSPLKIAAFYSLMRTGADLNQADKISSGQAAGMMGLFLAGGGGASPFSGSAWKNHKNPRQKLSAEDKNTPSMDGKFSGTLGDIQKGVNKGSFAKKICKWVNRFSLFVMAAGIIENTVETVAACTAGTVATFGAACAGSIAGTTAAVLAGVLLAGYADKAVRWLGEKLASGGCTIGHLPTVQMACFIAGYGYTQRLAGSAVGAKAMTNSDVASVEAIVSFDNKTKLAAMPWHERYFGLTNPSSLSTFAFTQMPFSLSGGALSLANSFKSLFMPKNLGLDGALAFASDPLGGASAYALADDQNALAHDPWGNEIYGPSTMVDDTKYDDLEANVKYLVDDNHYLTEDGKPNVNAEAPSDSVTALAEVLHEKNIDTTQPDGALAGNNTFISASIQREVDKKVADVAGEINARKDDIKEKARDIQLYEDNCVNNRFGVPGIDESGNRMAICDSNEPHILMYTSFVGFNEVGASMAEDPSSGPSSLEGATTAQCGAGGSGSTFIGPFDPGSEVPEGDVCDATDGSSGAVFGSTSSTPCAEGTTDKGVVDGYKSKKKYEIRICRYKKFGDFNSTISQKMREMVDAAEKDGVVLTGWGWRSNQRQIELRQSHCGGDLYNSKADCKPPTATVGNSNHQMGFANDYTENGSTLSKKSKTYQWLTANAANYGIYNLPSEDWHWSINGR